MSRETMKMLGLFSVFIFGLVLAPNSNAITPEVQQLIESWAPIIWLHSEETFWPSSVEFFLPAVTINDVDENVLQSDPTPSSILVGELTSTYHMQTKVPLDCPDCTNVDVFVGEPLVNGKVPPTYALYHEYGDADNTIDVYYHAFYPYNRGKEACVGVPTPDGGCVGPVETLGNHVGDWEHCTLRFKNGEPEIIYVSVHSFGAFYYWNAVDRRFEYYNGEPVRSVPIEEPCVSNATQLSQRYVPQYPPTVELIDNHPILYSANGSHGLWAAPGVHTYVPGIKLQDFTDEGTRWNTWENLTFVQWQPVTQFYEGDLSWMDYLGDWGNSEDGCQYEIVTGECILGGGPSGPRAKFECFPVVQP